jgi:hypothetical protein
MSHHHPQNQVLSICLDVPQSYHSTNQSNPSTCPSSLRRPLSFPSPPILLPSPHYLGVFDHFLDNTFSSSLTQILSVKFIKFVEAPASYTSHNDEYQPAQLTARHPSSNLNNIQSSPSPRSTTIPLFLSNSSSQIISLELRGFVLVLSPQLRCQLVLSSTYPISVYIVNSTIRIPISSS